jgi:hypothetical protein
MMRKYHILFSGAKIVGSLSTMREAIDASTFIEVPTRWPLSVPNVLHDVMAYGLLSTVASIIAEEVGLSGNCRFCSHDLTTVANRMAHLEFKESVRKQFRQNVAQYVRGSCLMPDCCRKLNNLYILIKSVRKSIR